MSILKFNACRGCEKNTLINDVWYGFTNYIFQAFSSATRLIDGGKLFECVKSADFFFFPSNYERATHKLRELNERFLPANTYWKFSLEKKEKCSLPSHTLLPTAEKQLRWKISLAIVRCGARWDFSIYYSNGLTLLKRISIDIWQIRQCVSQELWFSSPGKH